MADRGERLCWPCRVADGDAMMAKLYAVPLAAWVIAGIVVSIVGLCACLWWIVKENRE